MVARDVLCEDAGWWRRSQAIRDGGDGAEVSERKAKSPEIAVTTVIARRAAGDHGHRGSRGRGRRG